jgi:hypothetical protein
MKMKGQRVLVGRACATSGRSSRPLRAGSRRRLPLTPYRCRPAPQTSRRPAAHSRRRASGARWEGAAARAAPRFDWAHRALSDVEGQVPPTRPPALAASRDSDGLSSTQSAVRGDLGRRANADRPQGPARDTDTAPKPRRRRYFFIEGHEDRPATRRRSTHSTLAFSGRRTSRERDVTARGTPAGRAFGPARSKPPRAAFVVFVGLCDLRG